MDEVQNFSPCSDDIKQLKQIDNMSRANDLGSVASFENMIPNYANNNNTHLPDRDPVKPSQKPGAVAKPRPSTSQLSGKATKRMVNRVKLLKNVVDYRPITPANVTKVDHQASKKPFNKPTASSL